MLGELEDVDMLGDEEMMDEFDENETEQFVELN